MKKYSIAIRLCVTLGVLAPLFCNAILFLMGNYTFDLEPLFAVAIFAACAGWLIGFIAAENTSFAH